MANLYDKYAKTDLSGVDVFSPNLELLAGVLQQQQADLDLVRSEISRLPKHITEGAKGVIEAQEVQKYAAELKALEDNVYSGFGKGMIYGKMALNKAKQQILRDRLPGGKFYAFEDRYNQYQLQKEQLREVYKNNPIVLNYYNQALQDAIEPLNYSNGVYGQVRTPQTYRDVPLEDINKRIWDAMDKVKPDVDIWNDGVPEVVKNMGLNHILRTGKTEYIDREKLLRALSSVITQDDIQSTSILGKAYGSDQDQSLFLMVKEVPTGQKDSQGNDIMEERVVGNPNTLLGRMLESAISAGVYKNYDADYMKVTDHAGLENLRQIHRRELLTEDRNNPELLGPQIKIDKTVVTPEGQVREVTEVELTATGIKYSYPGKSKQTQSYTNIINDPYAARYAMPGIEYVIENTPRGTIYGRPETDEEYGRRLVTKWNSFINTTTSPTIRWTNTGTGEDRAVEVDKWLANTQGSIYYYPGADPKGVTWEQLLLNMGYKDDAKGKERIDGLKTKYINGVGKTSPDSPFSTSTAPAEIYDFQTKKWVQVYKADRSLGISKYEAPVLTLAQAKYYPERGVTQTVTIPYLDYDDDGRVVERQERVYAEPRPISEKDELVEQLALHDAGLLTLSQREVEQKTQRIKEINNNPALERITRSSPRIIKADGTPLTLSDGTEVRFEDITSHMQRSRDAAEGTTTRTRKVESLYQYEETIDD